MRRKETVMLSPLSRNERVVRRRTKLPETGLRPVQLWVRELAPVSPGHLGITMEA
jgi:hypothetical protein